MSKGIKKYRWLKYLAAIFLIPLALRGIEKELGPMGTDRICVSCHSMKPFFEEYQNSVHYMGSSGVRAGCVNCHIDGGSIISLKGASLLIKDSFREVINPIRGKDELEKRRPLMAKEVRDRLVKNKSKACFGCHVEDAIVPTKDRGKNAHESMKEKGKTCIECHFNLVHAKAPWEKEKKKEEAGGDELDGGSGEPEEEEL